jgi:hypothetical protein
MLARAAARGQNRPRTAFVDPTARRWSVCRGADHTVADRLSESASEYPPRPRRVLNVHEWTVVANAVVA